MFICFYAYVQKRKHNILNSLMYIIYLRKISFKYRFFLCFYKWRGCKSQNIHYTWKRNSRRLQFRNIGKIHNIRRRRTIRCYWIVSSVSVRIVMRRNENRSCPVHRLRTADHNDLLYHNGSYTGRDHVSYLMICTNRERGTVQFFRFGKIDPTDRLALKYNINIYITGGFIGTMDGLPSSL